MAFNLVNHFRKNQKVWMAAVLLLCMITFVLCTGVGGDLSDTLLRQFNFRRGEFLATVYGRNYYYNDLLELKKQRNLANGFMLKAIALCQAQLNEVKKEAEKTLGNPKATDSARTEAKQRYSIAMAIQGEFLKRTDKKPRYFATGVKVEELVDFIIWRNEADRLGINLVDDTLREMVLIDLFANQTGFDQQKINLVLYEASSEFRVRPSLQILYEALRQEYRVRLAQLALVSSQPQVYQHRAARELLTLKWYFPTEARVPLTPAQLWDMYQQKRAEFDVALLPIQLGDFVKKVEAPQPQQLTEFFDKYKNNTSDPASETPGFKIGPRVKAEWIAGDPEAPYYQRLATTANQLQGLPLASWNPLAAGLAGVVRCTAATLAWEGFLNEIYADVQRKGFTNQDARQACLSIPLTEGDVLPAMVARLTDRPTPAMVASLVGGLARMDGLVGGPAGFRFLAYQQHRALVDQLAAAEARQRAPIFAGLVASGASSSFTCGLAQAAYSRSLWAFPTLQFPSLPLAIVRPELEKLANNRQAQVWVQANMALVWRELNYPDIRGKAVKMQESVAELVKQFGLQHGVLKDFKDRYTIAQAPALAPLKQSYDKYFDTVNLREGRATPERRLQEGDFYKLFFEGEAFSAYREKYVARMWPPLVIPPVNPLLGPDQERLPSNELWTNAQKPLLFWKTDSEESRVPDAIDLVKERVEQAWKVQQAREKLALPEVKTVAEALLKKSGPVFAPVLREQEKKLGRDAIYLKNMALWNPYQTPEQHRNYGDYPLPRGVFEYPPDDLVKQLLTLPEPTKPLQTGNKEIDTLNKQLFDEAKKLPTHEGVGKYVQVLANKPRTVFYVACVTRQGTGDFRDFADEIFKKAAYADVPTYDRFLDRCQEEEAKEFQEALLQQLRREHAKLTDDQKIIDSFDGDTSSN